MREEYADAPFCVHELGVGAASGFAVPSAPDARAGVSLRMLTPPISAVIPILVLVDHMGVFGAAANREEFANAEGLLEKA